VLKITLTFPATLETVDSNSSEYRAIRRFELHTGKQWIKALRYKQDGCEFVYRWCHFYFLFP